jgi:DNA-binding transcriptional ArsR family regulator
MKPALPGVLGEISAAAGEAAAISIAARVGGTRVYIPTRLEEDHWLVEAVGREAAQKICAALGGDRHVIPTCGGGAYKNFRRDIARRVHTLDQEGKSAGEIARAVGLTMRAVHRHRAAHRGGGRKDDPQGSLF